MAPRTGGPAAARAAPRPWAPAGRCSRCGPGKPGSVRARATPAAWTWAYCNGMYPANRLSGPKLRLGPDSLFAGTLDSAGSVIRLLQPADELFVNLFGIGEEDFVLAHAAG